MKLEWNSAYATPCLLTAIDHGLPLPGQLSLWTTVLHNTTCDGITRREYTDDGFTSQAQMLSTLQKYYSCITLSSSATVIRWASPSLCNGGARLCPTTTSTPT